MTNEVTRATPDSAGCWIDGHWGQYATARMVGIAAEHGYANELPPHVVPVGAVASDYDVIDIAARHLASMGPSDSPDISAEDYEALIDLSDYVEAWMNENVAPEGFSFGWYDGEFFLSADHGTDGASWCELYTMESGEACFECES